MRNHHTSSTCRVPPQLWDVSKVWRSSYSHMFHKSIGMAISPGMCFPFCHPIWVKLHLWAPRSAVVLPPRASGYHGKLLRIRPFFRGDGVMLGWWLLNRSNEEVVVKNWVISASMDISRNRVQVCFLRVSQSPKPLPQCRKPKRNYIEICRVFWLSHIVSSCSRFLASANSLVSTTCGQKALGYQTDLQPKSRETET